MAKRVVTAECLISTLPTSIQAPVDSTEDLAAASKQRHPLPNNSQDPLELDVQKYWWILSWNWWLLLVWLVSQLLSSKSWASSSPSLSRRLSVEIIKLSDLTSHEEPFRYGSAQVSWDTEDTLISFSLFSILVTHFLSSSPSHIFYVYDLSSIVWSNSMTNITDHHRHIKWHILTKYSSHPVFLLWVALTDHDLFIFTTSLLSRLKHSFISVLYQSLSLHLIKQTNGQRPTETTMTSTWSPHEASY